LDHPSVNAISFVGSTAAARAVYARAAATGKRVQAQGGAKNPMVVLPDADLEAATTIVADSAFGCAGQRCLAASLAITVGESGKTFTEAIGTVARERRVGSGLDAAIEMGPVISAQSRDRIERLIGTGVGEGGRLVADGRQTSIAGYEDGFFIRPTVLADLPAGGELARTEIFGPVLGLIHVETVDEANGLLNSGNYGNMACLFTRNGAAARQFRYLAEVGNIGINLGVAAPMAHFPFSGWKDSFFGDLHG
jgi:malonate-semialdehyde dehydrogenase (acetylating)/methylmalonate-semialdehyde dehydrogenase